MTAVTDKTASVFMVRVRQGPSAPGSSSILSARAVGNNADIFLHRHVHLLDVSVNASSSDFGTIWTDNIPKKSASFVVCLGWCRRIGAQQPKLTAEDLRTIYLAHCEQGCLPLQELSGSFCLLSYDETRGTFWVAADAWGQGGVYYGTDPGTGDLLISNRAGLIANEMGAAIDGVSYLAWLREASIPPGRTLFSGVHRIPQCQALKVDARTGRGWLVPWRGWPEPQENWSYRESYERLKEALIRCIPAATSDPRTVIDLTAGNDSRMTVAALAAAPAAGAAAPHRFRIVGNDDHADLAGARAIAQAMGWQLTRNLPVRPEEVPTAYFEAGAVRGDTACRFDAIAARLLREGRDWSDIRFHVGSSGGQLVRNWMWQHEMFHPIHGTHVRYGPLLRHRLHNYTDVDFARISNGATDVTTHNENLLEGARAIDAQAPGLLDLYKLERIHLQTLSGSIFWCLSGQVNVILPFLWAELIDVSLRIPWRYKRTRALGLDLTRDCVPSLCGIPSDTGAPFRRLSVASAPEYLRYVTHYGLAVMKRHYRPGAIGMPTIAGCTLLPAWMQANQDLDSLGTPYDMKQVLASVATKQGCNLTRTEVAEHNLLLHIRFLRREYPRLRLSLDFKAPAGDLSATERQIAPSMQPHE